MATQNLSNGNTDGTVLGQSTTDKISFHGVSTVVQQTLTGTISTDTPLTTVATAVGEIQTLLRNYGLGSAA